MCALDTALESVTLRENELTGWSEGVRQPRAHDTMRTATLCAFVLIRAGVEVPREVT
jgi:hypothetical protein